MGSMTADPGQDKARQSALARQEPASRLGGWMHALAGIIAIYIFLAGINLMGSGLKVLSRQPRSEQAIKDVVSMAKHPVAGLCAGVLITSLVQSSSSTTSLVVLLVGSGVLTLPVAIPIVMGANIGTSVTNTLVSLININRRREFHRALGGAVVHDFFNILSVLVVLPLEVAFGIISKPAEALAGWLDKTSLFTANFKDYNVVKKIVAPLDHGLQHLLIKTFGLSPTIGGAALAIVGVLGLFAALYVLVKLLQGMLKERLSNVFSRTLFRNGAIAFVVGLAITATVQSSSVTTSLVVPLVGAGILSLRQIFPYTLGANIGTTLTAILTALAGVALAQGMGAEALSLAAAGLAVAFSHLAFNIMGTSIFWPLQWIPISLASGFSLRAARRRFLAFAYILLMFFIVPVVIIILLNRR